MNNDSVYVVLLNYNGYKDTIECVKSLNSINYGNYHICVVDNNSSDNSEDILRKEIPSCEIIQSGANLGFAGGNNIAINHALKNGADYILLLNNDTIVDKNFLDSMVQSFNNCDNVGIVGCKIMYYPDKNRIWYGGGEIDWFKFLGSHYGINELDKGQCDNEQEVTFMTGCVMLIKREVFEKVGLLPEEYFMYFEDVDFCLKVKEKGYRIVYNPNSIVYHKVSISSGGDDSPFSIKWCTRNRILFMFRYKNRISRYKYAVAKEYFYLTRLIRYIQYRINDKNKAKALIEGIREGKRSIKTIYSEEKR